MHFLKVSYILKLMTFNPLLPYNDLPMLPPPRQVLESPKILQKAILASRALAKLSAGKALPNQTVLLNSIFLREAKESSRIENIVTTDDELYEALADIEKEIAPNTKEVLHYLDALWDGVESIKTRPLGTTTFVHIMQIIKQNTSEIRKNSGTNLKNKKTGQVIYTPPEGVDRIHGLLKNLELFIYEEKNVDPIIKMAVMHYQFEAIHPFSDGNGRTGRILNILYLMQSGLLETPVLYLSKYIIEHKEEYYRFLLEVTTENKWEQWLLFMLSAVEETAKFTDQKMNEIMELMLETKELLRTKASSFYSKELLEVLFRLPYCKAKFLVEAGIAKDQTARKYLEHLAAIGLLQAVKIGRENLYINRRFLNLLKK